MEMKMKMTIEDKAERWSLRIYDAIGKWDFNTELLEKEIAKAKNKPLDIYINSRGGEVFEGFAIYNILKRYTGHKTVYVDGLAASIASLIAMAGDEVKMYKASMFMIHHASGGC